MGEVAQSFDYGLNAAAIDFDGDNKYLRITDIDEETHEFKTEALTSPDIDITTADNYRLQEGDMLFARTGASVGKTYRYIKSDGLVYFAGFLIRARIKQQYDVDFVFQNTLTEKYSRFITITSQRSGQPGVNAQEYADFAMSAPTLAEQTAIGNFLTQQDFYSRIKNQWQSVQHRVGKLIQHGGGGFYNNIHVIRKPFRQRGYQVHA